MKIDVCSLVGEPGVSSDTQIEFDFIDLIKSMFAKTDENEKESLSLNELTYL